MKKVYLDANATTRTDKEVLEAMLPFFGEIYGNASSTHFFGREAAKYLEMAREKTAELINADHASEIVFTSGGTESDNLAVKGVAQALEKKGKHIITSSVEHLAVLDVCKDMEKRGYQLTCLGVDKHGVIDLDELKHSIRNDTVLISIMAANNEVGTIMPVKEIGKIAREKNVTFHLDAVQAIGKIPFDVKDIGCDLASISAHKMYGPKGVGALYIKKGTKIEKCQLGGHQEKNLRAGTINTAGIVGLGKACELAKKNINRHGRIKELRDLLYEGLSKNIKNIRLNGHPVERLPNTLNITFDYLEGESVLLSLDMEGIAVSTGSACTSDTLAPSHVLKSMGIEALFSQGSVRFSLDKYTTKEDIDYVIEILPSIIERLRKMSPVYPEKNEVG
jgi:cysteine desulfurase